MPEDPEVVEPQEPTPPKGQEPPKPEEPEIEVVEEDTPNPLQPGGVRFEQVYAEKKQAEELAQRLAAEKARLEAQLATHQQQPPPQQQPTEREYTEDELDALEQQAQLRGDRNGLRAINNYRVQRQIKATLAEERQRQAQTSVGQNVGSQLFTIYKDLTDPASDLYKASANEYVEVVKEYAAMGRDAGKDPYATELAVSRAIRKNPELAKKTIAPKREVESEPGPVSDDQPVKPNKIVAKLTKRELDFCRRSGQDPKEYAKWRRERAAR
jgi:hypothetical protein